MLDDPKRLHAFIEPHSPQAAARAIGVLLASWGADAPSGQFPGYPRCQERSDPLHDRWCVAHVTSELFGSRLCAGHRQEPIQVPTHPESHAGFRDLGMELEPHGILPAPCLHRKPVAGGENFNVRRKRHAFGMPLIKVHRFRKDRRGAVGRVDTMPAHLAMAERMRVDFTADCPREQLPAETNAEDRFARIRDTLQPANFLANVGGIVVGRHRAAEDDGSRMLVHCRGKAVAMYGAANFARESQGRKDTGDPTGGRAPLVDDVEYWQGHGRRL